MAPALKLITWVAPAATVAPRDIIQSFTCRTGGSSRRMGRRYVVGTERSVCRLHGAGDVRGGQRREDERLQQGDQGLEQEDEDRQREGARGVDKPDGQAEQVPGREREDRQEQV